MSWPRVTSAGERIAARMVIVGIGVVPNAELAAAPASTPATACASMGRCGPRFRRSWPSATPPAIATGSPAPTCGWNRCRTPPIRRRLAARTITGHADSYASVPWFWSDIGDMKLQMVGLTAGSDRQSCSGETAENRFSVFHYAGDRLIGIESVNRPADHMLGRKMMGAGFSPGADLVAGGGDGLKAAFAAWQQARS